MPIEFLYLGIILVVAVIGFSVLKRPLHECMLAAFIVLLVVTNTWSQLGQFILDALVEPSMYAIIMFMISAELLSKTSIIDDCIAIILSVFGRIPGGAGFVAIIGSAYMGSLSGSGPGNVATTGVFTIPAMKKAGFPPHLAANVEAHASTMGNMIPPAGMIAVAFATLDKLYPNTYTISQYWMLLWVIAIYFVIQRIVTLMAMCKFYKVRPMEKADIPGFRSSLKKGWRAIFLPIIVFTPFFITNQFGDFFSTQLGEGASTFSNSILLFLPALIVICSILLSGKNVIKERSLKAMTKDITLGVKKVVPTASLVLFAYFISNLLETLKIENAIGGFFESLNLGLVGLAFLIPLFTAILGMFLPGSTQVKIFGGIIITILAAAGCNPLLACGMLPCICGAMHGVTPPYCACVYMGMGIANAELAPTLKNNMIWITIHYLLSVLFILGLIPMFGLA